jgi:hypothetical protein
VGERKWGERGEKRVTVSGAPRRREANGRQGGESAAEPAVWARLGNCDGVPREEEGDACMWAPHAIESGGEGRKEGRAAGLVGGLPRLGRIRPGRALGFS